MGKLSEEIIKVDQPQVQKTVSQMNSTQKGTVVEKPAPDDPQPGERLKHMFLVFLHFLPILCLWSLALFLYCRFRKIKEEEARKRQHREEEKRRAEEAASISTEIINDRHENEATVLERENGAGVKLDVENNEGYNSQNAIHNSSEGGVTMNGELSRQDWKEDQNTSFIFEMEDDDVSTTNIVETVEQQFHENHEKVLLQLFFETCTFAYC